MTDKEIKKIIQRYDFGLEIEFKKVIEFAISMYACPDEVGMTNCEMKYCDNDYCPECWQTALAIDANKKADSTANADDLKDGNESEPIPTTSIAHRRPLIYCAHPYRGDMYEAIDATEKIRELAKKYPQYTFVSPIHAIRRDYQNTNYEEGMECCMSLLAVCDAIYMMDGKQPWSTSIGCNMEYDFAIDHHMPIFKSDADLEAWAVKNHMKGLNIRKTDFGIDHSIAEDMTVNIIVHQCSGCAEKLLNDEIISILRKEILYLNQRAKIAIEKSQNAESWQQEIHSLKTILSYIENERDELNDRKDK